MHTEPMKQQIVMPPKTSFDDSHPPTTTYRYSHGRDNPNKAVLNAMNNDMLSRTLNKRQTTQGSGHDSVANCLNWYVPKGHAVPSTAPVMAPSPPTAPVIAPSPPTAPKPAPFCDNQPPPQQPKVAFAE